MKDGNNNRIRRDKTEKVGQRQNKFTDNSSDDSGVDLVSDDESMDLIGADFVKQEKFQIKFESIGKSKRQIDTYTLVAEAIFGIMFCAGICSCWLAWRIPKHLMEYPCTVNGQFWIGYWLIFESSIVFLRIGTLLFLWKLKDAKKYY